MDFLVMGGDQRFLHTATALSRRGSCDIFGFSQYEHESGTSLAKGLGHAPSMPVSKYSCVVLPLPASRDGENINTPLHDAKIPYSAVTQVVKHGGIVFAGKADSTLRKMLKDSNITVIDYFEREELTVMNAVLTAEGALEIILRDSPRAVFGANLVVVGFGRIAKALSRILKSMGANVTVVARKYADLSWAKVYGCKSVRFDRLAQVAATADVMVNTAPAAVIGADILIDKSTLLIDLASAPGFADCWRDRVNWALSLPGKCAPVTAGTIIADSILNILEEMGQG
jgi:dipicolinate synthase subunit A